MVNPSLLDARGLRVLTLFWGATLMFALESFYARQLLPNVGGTAALWNTCLVFFQVALFFGYAYAHVLVTHVPPRAQALAHAALVAGSLFVLPVRVPAGAVPDPAAHPVGFILGRLLADVGWPFFVLASLAPLLQRWWVRSTDAGNADPYPLYAASNAGALLALLAYPLIDAVVGLSVQGAAFTWGYRALVVLVLLCSLAAARGPRATESAAARQVPAAAGASYIRIAALAAVPSALLPSVTSYVSTDIGSTPLFWVIPLALYLATYVAAFARLPWFSRARAIWLAPFLVLAVAAEAFLGAGGWHPLGAVLHLATFAVVAMMCHGEMAALRPPPARLTAYYAVVSAASALGSLVVVLVMPRISTWVVEYGLFLAAACFLLPRGSSEAPPFRRADLLGPLGVALTLMAVVVALASGGVSPEAPWALVAGGAAVTLAACLGIAWRERPLRFGLCVVAIFLVGHLRAVAQGTRLHRARSFFGVHVVEKVARDGADLHRLWHGNTLHGAQWQGARADLPLSYFHSNGPLADVFTMARSRGAPLRIGVVGLGVGSIAAYGHAGDSIRFFEIDPEVIKIARDPRLFSFLSGSAAEVDVVLGDGRISLAREAPANFDLVILDAFSSDAIPAHLLTEEAVGVTLERLAPDGMVAFHISNRYIDLEPIVAQHVRRFGLAAQIAEDVRLTPADLASERTASVWIVASRSASTLTGPAGRWRALRDQGAGAPWTDDRASILPLLKWGAAF